MRPKKINRPAPINPVAEPSSSATARRFVLIGGFLGAGKTTVINEFCKWLKNKILVPGVITNDQGNGLIDTASATRQAAHVREVTGGCFCCRANALGAALAALEESARPDVFIAEPVGSCTDLMATLVLPLASIYGQPLTAAPMSVLIDAARLEAAMLDELTGSPGGKRSGFTADVRYIFEKQLEEAELLVLNKADMLTPRRLEAVRSWLAGKHPGKQILSVSNKTGKGLDEWFTLLMAEVSHPKVLMEVDYERYGVGEARMGWFNAALGLHSKGRALDANRLLMELAKDIQADLERAGAELAHFKMSLGSRAGQLSEAPTGGFAVVNAVRNGVPAALSQRSALKLLAGELLVNLRAEAEPELLDQLVSNHLSKSRPEWHVVWKHRAAFKPGQPKPTHRVTSL